MMLIMQDAKMRRTMDDMAKEKDGCDAEQRASVWTALRCPANWANARRLSPWEEAGLRRKELLEL
jgi:hypothetical protein